MRPKILIAAGLVIAFLTGLTASGIYTATTRAFNPAENQTAIEHAKPLATAFADSRFVQPKTVYVSQPVTRVTASPVARKAPTRSLKKEALIVGGSAGAGAAVGAVAGGGKGAAIGAVSGGVAGLVYDLMTRNK